MTTLDLVSPSSPSPRPSTSSAWPDSQDRPSSAAPRTPLGPLTRAGTEFWLDTGDIDVARSLWCAQTKALTTNNTLLNKEVQKGIYDALVPEAASTIQQAADLDEPTTILELAFVLNAVHGLTLVQTFGGKVSVELHTDLAQDVERSVAYGRRYHAICPSHFVVKVPLTAAGILAARRLSDEGIPINFTLGFSARQNLLIASLAKPAWCNVFMGRINAFLGDHDLGTGANAGEKATIASQRMLYGLRERGVSPTRQIGASMRGGSQVASLAGLDVYTAPPAVAQAYLEDPSLQEGVQNRMDEDYPVDFGSADGATDRLADFWEISEAWGSAAAALANQDLGKLDGPALQTRLAEAGIPEAFPAWTGTGLQSLVQDGKIPSYSRWKEEVRSGRLGWDGLLTQAGLLSFAQDQKALDDRIRAQLA